MLSVAFPFAVVGPSAVGGAEVVLSQIESALPSLGFRSVVVAREGSAPAGQLYATAAPLGQIDDETRALAEAAHQANIDRALAAHPVSVVHMHGLDFHRFRLPAGTPIVVTLHLPPGWYPERIWDLPSNYHLVCVSETQKASCPAHVRNRIQVIGNGVRLPDPASLRPGGRYALMLSRICPEKNLHTGFDAARLAGLPVLLGGAVFPYRDHQRYFAEEIEGRLTAPAREHDERRPKPAPTADARFLGPVAGAAKARLLSRAACLLLPSLAPETSSLVAMEALAAGVPVVAVASGAVPEIVEHGRTGLLVSPRSDTAANLATALRDVRSLDRRLCREVAEVRFPIETMLQRYAALYRQISQFGQFGGVQHTPPPVLEPTPVTPVTRVNRINRVNRVKEPLAEGQRALRTTLLVGTAALEGIERHGPNFGGPAPLPRHSSTRRGCFPGPGSLDRMALSRQ